MKAQHFADRHRVAPRFGNPLFINAESEKVGGKLSVENAVVRIQVFPAYAIGRRDLPCLLANQLFDPVARRVVFGVETASVEIPFRMLWAASIDVGVFAIEFLGDDDLFP